ncbi:hypothetical protein CIHG_05382 [Coccidioides immitis H538.4]|uniref:Uncharacterized protein n=1 Tax=Coccidioides immitis H538.4 TaxID=396776 RepID=A0A0J8RUF2_COCIT|nr:hypothetical protein CIHG_05382 [Coccidioides immitis H538.4]
MAYFMRVDFGRGGDQKPGRRPGMGINEESARYRLRGTKLTYFMATKAVSGCRVSRDFSTGMTQCDISGIGASDLTELQVNVSGMWPQGILEECVSGHQSIEPSALGLVTAVSARMLFID